MSVRPCATCGREFNTCQARTGHVQNCGSLYCACPTPNFDSTDMCRRCKRADLRAPRVAATFARVAERLGLLVPT